MHAQCKDSPYDPHMAKQASTKIKGTTWFQTQLILTMWQIRYHAIVGSS